MVQTISCRWVSKMSHAMSNNFITTSTIIVQLTPQPQVQHRSIKAQTWLFLQVRTAIIQSQFIFWLKKEYYDNVNHKQNKRSNFFASLTFYLLHSQSPDKLTIRLPPSNLESPTLWHPLHELWKKLLLPLDTHTTFIPHLTARFQRHSFLIKLPPFSRNSAPSPHHKMSHLLSCTSRPRLTKKNPNPSITHPFRESSNARKEAPPK